MQKSPHPANTDVKQAVFTHSPQKAESYQSFAKSAALYKQELSYDFDFNKDLLENVITYVQNALSKLKHHYINTAEQVIDEILVRGTQAQINDALHQFVVQNVDMVHDLHLDLHDDWLRLYATIYIDGIFASVAANFRLVQAQLNGDLQRFVFEQLSNTDIIELYSSDWYKATGAKVGLFLYHGILKKDPLPFILQQINVKGEPFAVHKGRFIYLDIGRYFKGSPEIINYLKKAQVNDAFTVENNLLAKLQINFGELINFGEAGEDIITEQDNPKSPTNQP